MPTTNPSRQIPQPKLDSFYAAIQRRRLLGELFGAPSDANDLDYEILGELGRGGMGIVYEAYHHRLDRTVAVKRVHDRHNPQMQRQLVHEARTMAKLAHPNIVTVFDIEHMEGTTVLVMEYVDGVTFRHWLNHDRPSIQEIVTAFIDAGEGLAAAHAKGLIHGDFKPSNVMIDREGRVRVMDFGLARICEDPGSRQHSPMPPGGGTPAYMAPEQLAGASADARSDQFAFCASLHMMIWGQGSDADPGPDLPQLAQIIRRGLYSDPRRRHASMRQLVDALRRVLEHAEEADDELGATTPVPTMLAPRPRSKHGGALGLLCLLAAGILLMLYAEPSVWAPAMLPSLGLCLAGLHGLRGPTYDMEPLDIGQQSA